MYIRGKIHRKIRELEDRIKKYLVNRIDKIDGLNESYESWLLIIDATDASFLNTGKTAELPLAIPGILTDH